MPTPEVPHRFDKTHFGHVACYMATHQALHLLCMIIPPCEGGCTDIQHTSLLSLMFCLACLQGEGHLAAALWQDDCISNSYTDMHNA